MTVHHQIENLRGDLPQSIVSSFVSIPGVIEGSSTVEISSFGSLDPNTHRDHTSTYSYQYLKSGNHHYYEIQNKNNKHEYDDNE